MAHVIDFTLFYGGVASAPAAELPFAGSSFDVQRGTARRAVFGVPEVESVAIVEGVGAVTKAASEPGVPALSYAALWEGAGGVSRTASTGAVSVSTGVELVEVGAGARSAEPGTVDVSTGVELDGLTAGARTAELGGLTVATGVELSLAAVVRTAELGTASVQNAVALDVGSAGESVAAFGTFAASTSVELDGLSAGVRTADLGLPEAYSTCVVEVDAVQGPEPAVGELAALQAVTATLDGFAREAAFGAYSLATSCEVSAASVLREAELGTATVLNALTLDMGGHEHEAPVLGVLAVSYGALAEPDGFVRAPAFGSPSIFIEVFPDSVVQDAAFGQPVAYSVRHVDAESVADQPAQVGGAVFYSAVTLDFASVVDEPARLGSPAVTTASFVELDGFGRTAVLGAPSIIVEVFPAGVERVSAVGAATFVSAKETQPASVPDVPVQVSGAEFVSVALVRPAGLRADSAGMGGGVTVETTALMLPTGLARQTAFGRPSLAVIVQPDSLLHESAIGGADLIPAHTADMAAFVQAAVFGVPDVGFGLLVEPESVEPRGHAFGDPAYSWRKCPRRDIRAQVMREAELGAEIRPAPVAAQVWRGEGCVRRERTMAAVVARWADLHTVARRRNAMDAAVRRKEQI